MPPFFSPLPVFTSAILLRATLLIYGLWQDAHSPLKYTDIDYNVFTSAASLITHHQSPYDRATYRYTPLLAWLLVPTTFQTSTSSYSTWWFSSGKVLFATGDIVAGWLIVLVLTRQRGMRMDTALRYASIWLLNPMVATISTRGSSEGLLGVLVVALLWAVMGRRIVLAGVLLGLGVHFKIYPFIYAPSVVWWLDGEEVGKGGGKGKGSGVLEMVRRFCNAARIKLAVVSLLTFMGLNGLMYSIYGWPFLQHTYLHHVTRIDHRHNFSPYNTLLYLSSSSSTLNSSSPSFPSPLHLNLESIAFIPQLFLSAIALPLILAKKDLPSTMLAQTFAFVTFNKVCTSQYFLWYMVFLPFYLPTSSLLANKKLGLTAAGLWVATQGLWLQQAFQLEFLGNSTFVPGLWVSSLLFFVTNAWILGIIVDDIGSTSTSTSTSSSSPILTSKSLVK
ncbi:GPI mannosyltransferase 1 [Lachnellula cervina]|uniref:GPI mannosyltransferase 1 n=1 Tax=Lachnellula cervina TaxID=1316786 RepID=A0A7D8UQM1_9HELO|nr:GPI mannosyltransferase 1 [Lachnellula cervina]